MNSTRQLSHFRYTAVGSSRYVPELNDNNTRGEIEARGRVETKLYQLGQRNSCCRQFVFREADSCAQRFHVFGNFGEMFSSGFTLPPTWRGSLARSHTRSESLSSAYTRSSTGVKPALMPTANSSALTKHCVWKPADSQMPSRMRKFPRGVTISETNTSSAGSSCLPIMPSPSTLNRRATFFPWACACRAPTRSKDALVFQADHSCFEVQGQLADRRNTLLTVTDQSFRSRETDRHLGHH